VRQGVRQYRHLGCTDDERGGKTGNTTDAHDDSLSCAQMPPTCVIWHVARVRTEDRTTHTNSSVATGTSQVRSSLRQNLFR
jgi:hypothetical protein